jgi:hypothetical protein
MMGVLVPKFAWAAAGIATTADTSKAPSINADFPNFITTSFVLVMLGLA